MNLFGLNEEHPIGQDGVMFKIDHVFPLAPMDPVERIKCMTMGKSDLHVCVMTHITLDLELFPFRRSVSNLIILHPVHLDKTLFAGTCILMYPY